MKEIDGKVNKRIKCLAQIVCDPENQPHQFSQAAFEEKLKDLVNIATE